ncbi:MAG: hypothetical protein IKS96_02710 [Fibrobacter sp.]|nr:hypothetical protein [Fibrobacter sp.]
MTGCKVYDKNVLRAKAFEVSNPKTPAQQVQRSFFKSLAAICATFNEDELRFLFPQKPKSMSRRNALSKQLAEDVILVDGEKVLDFASIDTLGNAPTMDFGSTQCVVNGSNVTVTLDSMVSQNETYGDNMFVVALVNVTKGLIDIPLVGEQIKTRTLVAPLPTGWESADEVNAIPLMTGEKKKIILVGTGTLGVVRRPAPGPSVTPDPTPTIVVECEGLNAWNTFSLDLKGTVYEGATPDSMMQGETRLCSSFNDLGDGSYSGSFLANVDSEQDATLIVVVPMVGEKTMQIRFVVVGPT